MRVAVHRQGTINQNTTVTRQINQLVKITALDDDGIADLALDLEGKKQGWVEAFLPDGSSLGRKPVTWWLKVLDEELVHRGLIEDYGPGGPTSDDLGL